MSHLSVRPGLSTSAEATLLTALYNLADSGAAQAIRKSGGNFFNVDLSGSVTLTVGTTIISSGTTTRILYDNAGVLGEYTISGTGNVAMTTSPSFTTPTLGVATATTINKVTITAPAGGSTITIVDSKVFVVSNTLTLAGSDGTTMTFPSTSATIARTDAANTFTGHQTIEGVTSTGATGTGKLVFDTSPVFTTPNIGVATGSVSGNAGTATALASVRTIWGQNFDGTGNVTGSLTAVSDITGGASSMTITAGTGNSRTLILRTTTSGGTATTALTLNADQTATFAAAVSIGTGNAFTCGTIELGAASDTTIARSGAGAITVEGVQVILSGAALGTPSSGTLTNCTGLPIAGLTASTSTALGVGSIELGHASDTTIARVSAGLVSIEGSNIGTMGAAQVWTGQNKFNNIIDVSNAITASGNAATVPVTYRLNTVTNNSAATLTITMTTASAVDGQMTIVRILDSSAATQTITWVNTENSTVSAPTTSNGSTTLFLTVGFIYNSGTSKWRCIASA